MAESTHTNSGPVTVTITRKIKPGREQEFEAWLEGVTAECAKFIGHEGATIIRPTAADPEYVLIFRFDSYAHLKAWEDSAIRQQWLDKVEPITIGKAKAEKMTGLEYWFTLPDKPAAPPPPPWKMIVVTVAALFPLGLILGRWVGPIFVFLPPLLRTLVMTSITITLMTYLVMPNMTRLFHAWLFPKQQK